MNIIDLHCDLLAYLETEGHTPLDLESNCSLSQLLKGDVKFQTLAIYAQTQKDSQYKGLQQVTCYQRLIKSYKDRVYPFHGFIDPAKIALILAIENASSFIGEDEPLEKGIKRLEKLLEVSRRILYLSLTWNGENRFGGGNASNVGLKPDGEVLLQWLAEHNICIDLSHTSDQLAEDIFNTIDDKRLNLQVIASHSNFRSVQDHPRNLPDHIAKELFKRGGVMGMNFVRMFVGETPEVFINHIEKAKELGGKNGLVLGADFFGDIDSPEIEHLKPFFFQGYDNSSCYPRFIKLLLEEYPDRFVEDIAWNNAWEFIQKRSKL